MVLHILRRNECRSKMFFFPCLSNSFSQFTYNNGSNSYVLLACVRPWIRVRLSPAHIIQSPASHIRDLDLFAIQAYPWCGSFNGYAEVLVVPQCVLVIWVWCQILTTEPRNAESICTVLFVKFIVLHVFFSLEETYLTLLENGKWVKLRVKIPEVLWGSFWPFSCILKRLHTFVFA